MDEFLNNIVAQCKDERIVNWAKQWLELDKSAEQNEDVPQIISSNFERIVLGY